MPQLFKPRLNERMRLYVGIDIGTTTLTAVAIDLEQREVVGAVTVANDAEMTSLEDRARGRSEWDFSAITGAAVKPPIAVANAPSIPAIEMTTSASSNVSSSANNRCSPATPTSVRRIAVTP